MSKTPRVHSRKRRLATLLLAEELGSVTKACREANISRSTFYEWKQRFEERGDEGLSPLPPIHINHPQTTSKRTDEKIKATALAHPALGCDRIRDLLPKGDQSVSSTTIQKILNRNGLGKRSDRWLALEQLAVAQMDTLSGEQKEFIQSRNPCFPKCRIRQQGPGWSMHAGSWLLEKSKNGTKVFVYAVVDVHNAYAFCEIIEDGTQSVAVRNLDVKINRFYRKRGRTIRKIHIADGFEFERSGLSAHGRELIYVGAFSGYLSRPSTEPPCCLQRFRQIVMEEFFRKIHRKTPHLNVDAMSKDLQDWLTYYNWQRKHEGYPNWGQTPSTPFR